jgi:hypothetical protein
VTGAEFSGVDIDLLADYVGGALDGTPDEAVVAALITEDTAWREAHALLTAGAATVTGQLQALGSAPEPMPAEVLARLDAALLEAAIRPPSDDATIGPAVMEPGTDGAAPARHLVAVPSGSRGRRARRLRWAAPVGIAAGVLAFVGFAFQQQFAGGASEDRATAGSAATAGAAAERALPQIAAGEELALPGGSVPLSESGTAYRRQNLQQAAGALPFVAPPELGEQQSDDFPKAAPSAEQAPASSSALNRLRVQAALRACLDAIAAEQGAGEITPRLIDFAEFDGAPALIVEFTTTAGGSWVWAAGPECGAAGADKLASVKVG